MESEALVKKMAYYTIFFVAMTLFVFFSVSAGFYLYLDKATSVDKALLMRGIYLPFVYAILSLAIALIMQFRLIDPATPNEQRIYAIALIFFFGLVFIFDLVVFISSGIKEGWMAFVGAVPSFAIASGEIVNGILILRKALSGLKDEVKAKNDAPKA
jgi:hypothetical protein